MPIVNIALRQGSHREYRQAISDGIHQALVETIGIPEDDRFHLITQCPADGIVCAPIYMGVSHSERVIFLQITLVYGRPVEKKRALYRRIVELLAISPGVDPADVIIVLTENSRADWSVGNGVAQLDPDE